MSRLRQAWVVFAEGACLDLRLDQQRLPQVLVARLASCTATNTVSPEERRSAVTLR
ncbi:hypothetical protein [Saccharopolyspora pogona]|uniref:hypothetical protein n=1 Tax=Saccharopolyspora pogona TaxID=333966 RepID=UPI00168784B5|nr:hypothetical protein [Saccharopolyspora pogona]